MAELGYLLGTGRVNSETEIAIMDKLGAESMSQVALKLRAAPDATLKWALELIASRQPNIMPAGWDDYQKRKIMGDSLKQQVKQKAALGSSSGAIGGYTIPQEIWLHIDSLIKETGIFHSLAWNLWMGSVGLTIPSIDLTTTHATGKSPLLGGFKLVWGKENTALTEAEPSFAGSLLKAANLQIYLAVSNQLVDDGGEPLAKYLETFLALAVEEEVEYACFRGTGVNEPMGIINSPATVSVTRTAGSDVQAADLSKMMSQLLPASFATAIWCVNPSTLDKIFKLTDFAKNETHPVNPAQAGYLLSRPLYVTEKLPALGTKGDVMLFDPRMYVLATRMEGVVEASPHPNFLTNQTVFRLVWRGNGQPLPKGTVTLADGSTTAGCFVALN